jgi:hypothetical protein
MNKRERMTVLTKTLAALVATDILTICVSAQNMKEVRHVSSFMKRPPIAPLGSWNESMPAVREQ